MAQTLLLDTVYWDLVLDSAGNIAVASDPYSLAQDAASAIKLFLGELWFDTAIGVPYFTELLGKSPPLALIKARMVQAAVSVPGIVSAQVFITAITDRTVNGQVQVADANGILSAAAF